jgi:hypothetical protein
VGVSTGVSVTLGAGTAVGLMVGADVRLRAAKGVCVGGDGAVLTEEHALRSAVALATN